MVQEMESVEKILALLEVCTCFESKTFEDNEETIMICLVEMTEINYLSMQAE